MLRKSRDCKICNSFDDDTLYDITLDILLKRRSWAEISKHYTPLLPPGRTVITDVNIRNHKRHSDPSIVTEELLKFQGRYLTKEEQVTKVYLEIFKKKLDQGEVLQDLYKERLNNLKTLQELLNEVKVSYREGAVKVERDENVIYKSINNEELLNSTPDEIRKYFSEKLRRVQYNKAKLGEYRRDILSITKAVDGIQSDLQNTLLKDKSVEKGIPTVQVNQYLNVFQGHLNGFLEEIIPHLLMNVFKNDEVKGKEIIKYLTDTMDKHITPVFEGTKLLASYTME